MIRDFEVKLNKTSIDFTKQTGTMLSTNMTYSSGDWGTAYIGIELKNEGRVINLEGYSVVVNITRRDRTRIVTDSQVVDSENGLIEILLSREALTVGINHIEIMLIKDGRQLVSPTIPYKVVKTLESEMTNEEVMSSTEFPILVRLIDEVDTLKAEYQGLVQELEASQTDIDDIIGMVGDL